MRYFDRIEQTVRAIDASTRARTAMNKQMKM
jgi:hypothetical protein